MLWCDCFFTKVLFYGAMFKPWTFGGFYYSAREQKSAKDSKHKQEGLTRGQNHRCVQPFLVAVWSVLCPDHYFPVDVWLVHSNTLKVKFPWFSDQNYRCPDLSMLETSPCLLMATLLHPLTTGESHWVSPPSETTHPFSLLC